MVDALRTSLSPAARRRVRTIIDPVLAPIGSIGRIRTNDRICALTFDDGPEPESTPAMLDVLAAQGATATFFVLVPKAKEHADIVRRAVDAGHEIALHGPDHFRLPTFPMGEIASRLSQARCDLEAIVGGPVTRMRPPFGAQSLRSYFATRRAGLDPVVWSADAEDWIDRTPAAVAELALTRIEPGTILLLHDAWEGDPAAADVAPTFDRAEMLDRFLSGLRQRDYEASSVERMLDRFPARRTAWFRR
jgi:peptidoglycan/xylan/chitin deacetylase (PgdA/CDA1 family)